LIQDSLADGIVQRAFQASQGFRMWGGTCAGIWWWCKHAVKFVHHQKLLIEWLNAGDELQLLIRPDALLHMQEPKGDCAVFTTLVCAMLDCAGIQWEICTVAVDPRQPGVYSHVYPRAVLPNGTRLPLDASHGKYPGWEVPAERVSAKQVWDEDGKPIEDLDSGYRGLHGVNMFMDPVLTVPYYGLGCDCSTYDEDGTCTDPDPCTSTPVLPTGPTLQYCPDGSIQAADGSCPALALSSVTCSNGITYPGGTTCPSGSTPTTVTTAPGSTSVNPATAAALSSEMTALTKIFGNVVAPQVTVTRNANGSYSYSAPAGTATTNPISSLFSSTTLTGSSMLLYAGIGIAVLFLISSMGKK